MAFELAIRPNASKADVSQTRIRLSGDRLLCREAYEIGRKDGGMCSPRETIITLLVVTITIRGNGTGDLRRDAALGLDQDGFFNLDAVRLQQFRPVVLDVVDRPGNRPDAQPIHG